MRFAPGIWREDSELGEEGHFFDCDHVRFRAGQAEKIGGWTLFASQQLTGIPRAVVAFRTASGAPYTVVLTHSKWYAHTDSTLTDITAIASSGTATSDPFITVSGSATVEVRITAHGAAANDYVNFPSSTSLNGTVISGEYLIQSASDADGFTITTTANATDSGSGGGAGVRYEFDVGVGLSSSSLATNGVVTHARTFALDMWGINVAIINPRGGAIYQWSPSDG